jgi:hypothetical protein
VPSSDKPSNGNVEDGPVSKGNEEEEESPKRAEEHFEEGKKCQLYGLFRQAITSYRNALKLNHLDYKSHNNLGLAL